MKTRTFLASLLFVPSFVFAQTALPNAGLTPDSPFYFLDTLGETLQEFFTFSPEGKARLNIAFAAERMAEIQVMLATKGVDAKGLGTAQERLRSQLSDATDIVSKQKSEGKDVSELAKELNDSLVNSKSALSGSLDSQKQALEIKKHELEKQIEASRSAGDTAQVEASGKELEQVNAQLTSLEPLKESLENDVNEEQGKLEDEMSNDALEQSMQQERDMFESDAEKEKAALESMKDTLSPEEYQAQKAALEQKLDEEKKALETAQSGMKK